MEESKPSMIFLLSNQIGGVVPWLLESVFWEWMDAARMLSTHNGLTIRRIEEKNDSSGMLFFFDSFFFFLFLSLKCHLQSRSITETKDPDRRQSIERNSKDFAIYVKHENPISLWGNKTDNNNLSFSFSLWQCRHIKPAVTYVCADTATYLRWQLDVW